MQSWGFALGGVFAENKEGICSNKSRLSCFLYGAFPRVLHELLKGIFLFCFQIRYFIFCGHTLPSGTSPSYASVRLLPINKGEEEMGGRKINII